MPNKALKEVKKKKNPAAVRLGRSGGLKGGKARMSGLSTEERSELGRKAGLARLTKLTPEQRSAVARAAAKSRWSKHK